MATNLIVNGGAEGSKIDFIIKKFSFLILDSYLKESELSKLGEQNV